ncbi:hypothetical protein [Congregibacter litoralis]|uniref:Uncharacterized protein n=1 Tax=Congregibacter litoralis KT71 TaxID=314285 RepID=A4AD62_9GAMM|nr:hypothetical protein [Congregibacter litoralis]EAQ96115.1 hypothetical protein KT71_08665 [Congregibacter litoralis KT71]
MKISNTVTGISAVEFLNSLGNLVEPHLKDGSDKMWSYKIKGESNSEFAFDPKTTTTLNIWFDRRPPILNGVADLQDIRSKNKSTALRRVFSGKGHTAKYKATIESFEALREIIDHLANDH